jgi:hypothetical protein
VLKLFEGGLSEVEARDLVQVRELLDEIDMKRMAPVFVELEERLARLRAFGLEVDEMRRILEQKNRFRHVTKRR